MNIGSLITFDPEILGKGSYGKIRKCKDEYDNLFAVKIIEKKDKGIPNILEASIMSSIFHQTLNSALCIHSNDKELYIFQELAMTDLSRYTRAYRKTDVRLPSEDQVLKRRVIPKEQIRLWLFSIAEAVECLHKQRIIHADIKASNVLLYKNNTVRLTDFTLATKVWDEEKFNFMVCTCTHRPLECFVNQGWSFPLDIWSLGCTFYEVMYGQHLFRVQQFKDEGHVDCHLMQRRSINCLLDWAERKPNGKEIVKDVESFPDCPFVPFRLPSEFYKTENELFNNLVLSMLSLDPEKRPTINEVLNHEYFNGLKRNYTTIVSPPKEKVKGSLLFTVESVIRMYANDERVAKNAMSLFRATVALPLDAELKAKTCVWIAAKLVRNTGDLNLNVNMRRLTEAETLLCNFLSFRLHTCCE